MRDPFLAKALCEFVAPALFSVLSAFTAEPGADLFPCARSAHQLEPIPRRAPALLGCLDLDDVATLQSVMERNHLAVHFGPNAAVTDVGVHRVGEVERRRARREALDLTLRRKHIDLILEKVLLQRGKELTWITVPFDLEQPAEPGHLFPRHILARAALLVDHMCRDPILGQLVHLLGANLDLEWASLRPDYRCVESLVHVRSGHGDHVLEPTRQRLPEGVDYANRSVTVLDRVDDHPHRGQIEDLVELLPAAGHLGVDRIEVLGSA